MSSPDQSLPEKDPSIDSDATAYHPSSDPDATEYHSGLTPGSPRSVASGFVSGSRLNGIFRLEKQLGRGGMGEAWKAFDETANRHVVLKFIPKEIQHVREVVDSVRSSFGKVHELQHQHICPVYGLFTDPHHGLYLVMKFIDGLPLDEYKRRTLEKHGKISFSDTVQILWGIAKGLDYAHEKRVIHRDIKPQNVMISKKDGVQIIDFGLAEEIRTSMVKFSEVTMDVAGTRPYMAPEQWKGRLQDARTDQYALAVTAYELFSGHVPFHGSDVGILRECVLHDEPEPIAALPDYVNAALLKGLAKKRDDRFENCKAFVKAMAAKPKAETVDAELLPGHRKQPEVSIVPALHSDPVSGQTQAISWRPTLSTGSSERTQHQDSRKRIPWIPILTIAPTVLLVLGLIVFFSMKPSSKPVDSVSKSTGKPVETASKPEKPTKKEANAGKPVLPTPTPVSPEPEILTPEQYHQLEVETIERLLDKCNVYMQVQIDGKLKEVSRHRDMPKEFSKLVHLGFWSGSRTPAYAAGPGAIDCIIPGYRHNGGKCSCKLSPEELKNINRLRKNESLNIGGLQLTSEDLETLLRDLNIGALHMMSIPTLPHWEPVKNLTSLKQLNAFANVLNRTHIEAVAALPDLQNVNFSQCYFIPGTLEPLTGNAGIQNLDLSRTTCLTGRDVAALAAMNELTELNLVYTPLNATDLNVLAETPKLKKIKLCNNGLTAKEVDEFRKTYPSIELDLTGQTGFPLPLEEISDERNEIHLAEVAWKSAKTFVSGPGLCEVHTNQNKYGKSFYTPSPSALIYRPSKQWKRFESVIGIVSKHTPKWYETNRYIHMPGGGDSPSVVFVVKGDGRELYRSELITDSNERFLSVDISGVDTLELIVEDGGDGPRFDAAAWCDPKLIRDVSGVKETAESQPGLAKLSDMEKISLQQKYPELDWTGARVVVLPEPTEAGLRLAFAKAAETPENDFIVVRTTKEKHKIVLNDGQIGFDGNVNDKGGVALISLGPEKLILDGNKKGRIFLIENGAKTDFGGVVFTNGCVVDSFGGAVSVTGKSSVGLFRCDVFGNACIPEKKYHRWEGFGGGGVMVWDNSSLVLRDVLFEGNSIVKPEFRDKPRTKDMKFSEENSGALGLGDFSSLVATNAVFRGNFGGAIYAYDVKEFELRNVSLIDNKMQGWSGAIFLFGSDADQTYKIVNLFATGNTGGHLGGALHISGKGRYVLDHLTLVGNAVGHTGQGGGICFDSGNKVQMSEVTLTNSIITGNRGDDITDFVVLTDKIEKLNIRNCITGETRPPGRKWFSDGQNNRIVKRGELRFGEFADFGNGIPVRPLLKGSPAIDAGIVTENTPKTDITGRPRNVGKAPDIGAFEWQNDSPEDSTASSSLSDDEKKSLQQKYPELDWTGARVTVLSEPTEVGLHQAIQNMARTPEDDIIVVRTTKEKHRIVLNDGCFRIQNTSNEKGKLAILSLGPEKLVLDGNKKDQILIMRGGIAAFAGIVFTNGVVTSMAGGAVGIAENATVTFLDCDFIDNTCLPGELRLWWEGFGGGALAGWDKASLVLRDVRFEGNRNNVPEAFDPEKRKGIATCSDSSGALLLRDRGSLVATNVVFRNNHGGAAFIHGANFLAMRNIAVIDNKSLGGGAVHFHGNDPNQTYRITNYFAAGNRSGEFGGGLHIGGKGKVILDHLTLIDNFGAHGGGLCLGGGGGDYLGDAEEIVLSNSLIANNKATHTWDFNVHSDQFKKLTFSNCITSEKNTFQLLPFWEGRNIHLVEPGELKFGERKDFGNGIPVATLLPGSPAIDAGIVTENMPETDITGRPRNIGKAPDIGAFEYQSGGDAKQ